MNQNLSPQLLWKHFFNICKVPHCSHNEQVLAQEMIKFADSQGLESKMDKIGNVVISKPATPGYENKKGIVLQAHLDMVGEKNSDSPHNFDTDPIQTVIEGDFVTAIDTTLGADNGIGMAAALAILEDKTLKHPSIEALFTIAEETGLNGAAALTPDSVKGRILLNLDSEDWGEFCVGCAGGQRSRLVFPFEPVCIDSIEKKRIYKIDIKNLAGGHSGVDIHEHRGNALKIAGLLLVRLLKDKNMNIISIKGGNKDNAIPRESSIILHGEAGLNDYIKNISDKLIKAIIPGLPECDQKLQINICTLDSLSSCPQISGQKVYYLTYKRSYQLASLLAMWPSGVAAMSNTIEGLVETSSNLAIVDTHKEYIHVTGSARSSVDTSIEIFEISIDALALLAGAKVEHDSKYPGWNPNMNSAILEQCKHAFTDKYSKEPIVSAIHAGLECGIIGRNIPGMDMISMGPDIFNPHCPDEKVSISSVEKFYEFLVYLLSL